MTTLTRLFITSWRPRSSRLAAGSIRFQATTAEARALGDGDIKPFSEVPRVAGLPIIGSLFESLKEADRFHTWTTRKHQELGPIFRNKVGIIDAVFVADADAVEKFMRQGGKYPERLQIELWLDYRKRHDIPLGLLMSDGPAWHNLRRVIDKPMLKIKTVNSYAVDLNKTTAEFVDRMYRVRSPDNSIPRLDEELYSWSAEGICRVLFEKRMGCLDDNRDPDVQKFIDSSHNIFECTRKMAFFPPWLARIVTRKAYNQLEEAWGHLFKYTYKSIDAKLEEMETQIDRGEEVGFLATLLKDDTISTRDIYGNVTELMGAAIDTTSSTTMMLLYELSRSPHVQEKLYEEVARVISPGEQPTPDHLKDMHYLKAIIKETLRQSRRRMYPIGSAVMRRVNQDSELLGYRLPHGTLVMVVLYAMGRSPRYYDDPDTFKPERWLRSAGQSKVHPFAWLPFGFVPRMCIGRRVAELEIQLLIAQLMRRFHIEPVSMEPIEMKTDLLLLPKTPVQIRLIDRA